MYPTLEGGQYILINKLGHPEQGDVIVFHSPTPRNPTRNFVKRVIGLPGHMVEIRRGDVYIDGVPLDEPHIKAQDNSNMEPMQLGEKEYFVLGDNRRASLDSRRFGPSRSGERRVCSGHGGCLGPV